MKPNKKLVPIESCPVCGEKEFSLYLETKDYFLSQEAFTIDQCRHCGFVFTNPIPALSSLSKYYDSPDYLSHTASAFSIKSEVYKLFRKANIKNKYNLLNQLSKGKTLLDIGCGTGELLHYFDQKNWKVTGVEPNSSARKFAKSKYNLEVFDEEALDGFEENSFDVISMWHVLEHVPDLNNRMRQLKKLLKKDGIIVLALPNLNSPDAHKYGAYWAGLDVPRHLYHFTKDSVQTLLTAHNLTLVDSIPMKFDAFYVSLLSEKYKASRLSLVPAFWQGLQSNKRARKDNNYSSMIFVVKAHSD